MGKEMYDKELGLQILFILAEASLINLPVHLNLDGQIFKS